jgi:hypothetical protein
VASCCGVVYWVVRERRSCSYTPGTRIGLGTEQGHETRSERERDGAGSSLCLSLSLFLRGSVSGLVWQWQRCVLLFGGAGGRDTGSKGPARQCEAAMCGGSGIGTDREGD